MLPRPDWLQDATSALPSPAVGVAIQRTAADFLHVAVLHRGDASQPPRLLSQDWHTRLSNDEPTPGCWWVDARLLPDRAEAVAALCRRIYRRNRLRGIPYGVHYDGGRVREDYLVELSGRTHGLTCATFVMLVFQEAGAPLLRPETWPTDRAEDARWHDRVVALLEQTGVPADHVANVRSERGCARFRPEETAGACSCEVEERPSAFADVEPRGQLVRTALTGSRPPLGR